MSVNQNKEKVVALFTLIRNFKNAVQNGDLNAAGLVLIQILQLFFQPPPGVNLKSCCKSGCDAVPVEFSTKEGGLSALDSWCEKNTVVDGMTDDAVSKVDWKGLLQILLKFLPILIG